MEVTDNAWTDEMILQALGSCAEIENATVDGRMTRGRTTTWAITLAAPPDKDAFPIRYERDGEEAAIWVRRALPRQPVILHKPAKGDNGSYNFSEEQVPIVKELVTEKKAIGAARESGDVPREDGETTAKQEEGGDAAPPMKKREVEKRVPPEGLVIKKVASDGNSVVAAFALAHADAVTRIEKRKVKPQHPRQTRAALVTYMAANASTFEGMWDGKGIKGEDLEGFKKYLTQIATSNTTLGGLEYEALARLHKAHITIIPERTDIQIYSYGELSATPVVLWLTEATWTQCWEPCRRGSRRRRRDRPAAPEQEEQQELKADDDNSRRNWTWWATTT